MSRNIYYNQVTGVIYEGEDAKLIYNFEGVAKLVKALDGKSSLKTYTNKATRM